MTPESAADRVRGPGPPRVLRALPNALSILRLALAAFFPFASVGWRPAIVVVAAFSDLADGFAARRFGVTSWVGGILDAVADKVFMLTVLVTLAADGRIAAAWIAPLLARDSIVLGLALRAAFLREWAAFRKMPARIAGKVTTAALFLMFLVLVAAPDRELPGQALIALTALASVTAAVDYFACYLRAQRRTRSDAHP